MKSILSLVLYTATALAQGIYIESPAAGTELKAGETITVQIGRPVRPSHSPTFAFFPIYPTTTPYLPPHSCFLCCNRAFRKTSPKSASPLALNPAPGPRDAPPPTRLSEISYTAAPMIRSPTDLLTRMRTSLSRCRM